MTTLKRIQANNTNRYFTNKGIEAVATNMKNYTHIVYIKYASGWEKNICFATEETIDNTVKSLLEKGFYRVYVRELTDTARANEKVFTK